MEKLSHPLWLVEGANAVFGPVVAAVLRLLGRHVAPGAPLIPDYLVMAALAVLGLVVVCLVVRSGLSVDNPSRLQILCEDGVLALEGVLTAYIGPKARRYLPLGAALFTFILVSNLMGIVPGMMAPTENLNVPVGCALTVWCFYHLEGVRAQGLWHYLKHFAAPPGVPAFVAPLMLPIEIISHLSRVVSLSLRLFGNIFGEDMVIAIAFSIIPFLAPIPMIFMDIITSVLQAFIFLLLTAIYLGGAVATEHDAQTHGEFAAGEV